MREIKFRVRDKMSEIMREIKFRVWDKIRNIIKYLNDSDDSFFFKKDGTLGYENLQNGSSGDDYELMQFTGLKDDNGKDIYESDILRIYEDSADENPDYIDVVVYFNSIGKCLSIDYDFGDYNTTAIGWALSYFDDGNMSYEVIGNIYENPELMEAKNDN